MLWQDKEPVQNAEGSKDPVVIHAEGSLEVTREHSCMRNGVMFTYEPGERYHMEDGADRWLGIVDFQRVFEGRVICPGATTKAVAAVVLDRLQLEAQKLELGEGDAIWPLIGALEQYLGKA